MMTEHIVEGTLVRLTRSSVDGGWPFYFFIPDLVLHQLLSSCQVINLCHVLYYLPQRWNHRNESPIMCELCKEHISFSQAVM